VILLSFQNLTGNAANPLKKILGLQRREWAGTVKRKSGAVLFCHPFAWRGLS